MWSPLVGIEGPIKAVYKTVTNSAVKVQVQVQEWRVRADKGETMRKCTLHLQSQYYHVTVTSFSFRIKTSSLYYGARVWTIVSIG